MKFWKLMLIMALMAGLFVFVACDDDDDDDDDNTGPVETIEDMVVGEWLSAGDDVAALLVTYFSIDSVVVTFNENQTVTTNKHVIDTGWSMDEGTWSIVESDEGAIHTIHIDYTAPVAYSQDGIIRVVEGTEDVMTLEVVQTDPDIQATVPTVDGGFGVDPTLTDMNVQTYRK